MSDGGVSEREFGQLEQRVRDLPTHSDLRDLIRDIREELTRHEGKTEKLIESATTRTVESAFKLQWAEIDKHLKANAPPKRDWGPYIMAGAVLVFAGLREGFPFVMRLMGA